MKNLLPSASGENHAVPICAGNSEAVQDHRVLVLDFRQHEAKSHVSETDVAREHAGFSPKPDGERNGTRHGLRFAPLDRAVHVRFFGNHSHQESPFDGDGHNS